MEQEFNTYVADMRTQEKENKDRIESQVPPERLIEARGAISDAVDAAIKASRDHYDKLVTMVERLTVTENQ